MMDKGKTIMMSKFKVNVSELDETNESLERLNNVKDIYFYSTNVAIKVEMEFVGEELTIFDGAEVDEEVQSQVTVSVYGDTMKHLICRRCVDVQVTAGSESREYSKEFVLSRFDLLHNKRCMVVVRELSTNKVLGKHMMRVYRHNGKMPHPAKWYEVLSGCFTCPTDAKPIQYRTLWRNKELIRTVRFNVRATESALADLPELEIRMHYRDESVTSCFCPLKKDSLDAGDDCYHVEHDFFVNDDRLSVLYAELLCMGTPISGFVAHLRTDTECGVWSYDQLRVIADYNPELGNRLVDEYYGDTHESCDDEDGDAVEVADVEESQEDDLNSEFERLLKQYTEIDVDLSERADDDDDDGDDVIDELAEDDDEDDANDDEEKSEICTIEQMVGLKEVKLQLDKYKKLVLFNNMRKAQGLKPISVPLHSMFLGSPGTGKTTVAKNLGVWLKDAGVLSRGHVVVRERSTLSGTTYGSDEEKTRAAIAEAQGGILLIDEAYQLYQPNDPKDPGGRVIETLLTALSDESNRDWMLILAGYPDQMLEMFKANPGLRSRIPQTNIYTFADYDEHELMQIAYGYFSANGFWLTDGAREALEARLHSDCEHRDKEFGNARHVVNIIQTEIIPNMAVRVCADGATAHALESILASDVPLPKPVKQAPRMRIGYV